MRDRADVDAAMAALPDAFDEDVKQYLAFRDGHRRVAEYVVDAFPEPVTAGDVAERFGWNRVTATNRLRDVHDAGAPIATKQVGARARVWWYAPPEYQPKTDGGTGDGLDGQIVGHLTASMPEPATATEIADALDRNRVSVRNALVELAESDDVDIGTKHAGSRARVWWCHDTDRDGVVA